MILLTVLFKFRCNRFHRKFWEAFQLPSGLWWDKCNKCGRKFNIGKP